MAPSESARLKGTVPSMRQGFTILRLCFTTQFTMSDLGNPSMSPSCVVTTLRTGVRPITSCSVEAKFSRITMPVAPASFSWYSSSRGV